MLLTPAFIFFVSLYVCGIHAELLAVIQIFRHGHRTSVSSYPNDPHKDHWKELGPGQLTNEGKRQHFKLGQFTRSRYSNFIPKTYDPSFFHAETTDVDRTHMSAQTNIYGLFPASTKEEQWRDGIDWQPIPVHPANTDILSTSIAPESCTTFRTEFIAELNSEKHKNYEIENTELFDYLTKHSGQNITGIISIGSVWDPLKVEDAIGLKLPEWTKSVYPEPLKSMNGKYFEIFAHSTKMQRLGVGPFLNEVVKHFELIAADPTSSYRFKMYSAHDTNIAATLYALGLYGPDYPGYPPSFQSSIYFELHQENGEHVVKVFTKDSEEIIQVSARGCPLDCPLDQFREYLSPVVVDVATRDKECQSSGKSKLLQGSSGTRGKYTDEEVKLILQKFTT